VYRFDIHAARSNPYNPIPIRQHPIINREEPLHAMPIRPLMAWSTFQYVWPVLAILTYILVTTVLRVLAMHRRYWITLHDRICESRNMRRQYLKDIGG